MEQALRHYQVVLTEGEETRTLTFACKGVKDIRVENPGLGKHSVWIAVDVEGLTVFAGQGVQCIYEVTNGAEKPPQT